MFEIEQNYLDKVEVALQKEVDKNNRLIEDYQKTYNEKIIKNGDSSMPGEERKVLMVSVDSLVSQLNYLVNENYRFEKIKYSPYFAKITIKEDGEICDYYIGTKNLTQQDDLLIIDWRAPICSIFYNSKLGETYYVAPSGKINVDLQNKRQFKIENGKLINYYDNEKGLCDNALLDSLNEASAPFLKNIISTIQVEQDEIIRMNSHSSLVINGVAGSGKTSIGMHRIAYLLYADKENLSHKNFLIISPNTLFTEYISHLLPELGEENVATLNITTIYAQCLDEKVVIQDKNSMVEEIMLGDKNRLVECKVKYSLSFLKKLNEFLANYNNVDKIVENLIVGDVVIPTQQIKKIYYKPNQENIKLSIEFTADKIVNNYFYNYSHSRQDNIKKFIIKYFYKKVFNEKYITIYYNYLKSIGFSTSIKKESKINYEDISALCYIKHCIMGLQQNYFYKQVFIDEMQDYDAISIKLWQIMFPNAQFTIVGDYSQNLLFQEDNKYAFENFFKNSIFYNLSTNYRSTYNIAKFASKIINREYKGEIIREGEEPVIIETYDSKENIEKIKQLIDKLVSENKKVAIICKSVSEIKFYEKYLTNCYVLSKNEMKIEINKPILTNVFYAKGLEFDAVILPNVNDENYHQEEDKNLLYVATTRALHQLYIFYINKKSQLIEFE